MPYTLNTLRGITGPISASPAAHSLFTVKTDHCCREITPFRSDPAHSLFTVETDRRPSTKVMRVAAGEATTSLQQLWKGRLLRMNWGAKLLDATGVEVWGAYQNSRTGRPLFSTICGPETE